MNLKERTDAFVKVGMFINRHFNGSTASEAHLHEGLEKVIEAAFIYNGWFSPDFTKEAIKNLGTMLNEESLNSLSKKTEAKNCKIVALICAGNIPMVGFHDILCVLLSGHKALIKMSADDNVLLPFFLKLLTHYEPRFEEKILFASGKISGFDAVIATGSNNTAGHFQYYFGKYPNIIRKNRTSIAVLDGTETEEELKALGKDIFLYYGLGCRNVGKLLIPEGFSLDRFFTAIYEYGHVVDNKKYGNNYDYHRAIYLLEKQDFLDNNFLTLKQSSDLHSPVSSLYYQTYKTMDEVKEYLKAHEEQLQCIVGHGYIPFGYSQQPVITDFADNINTWDFLVSL